MAFPSVPIRADSSLGLLNVFKASARARNGDFAGLPKLSNGDIAQMAAYFRKHDADGWDKLARVALGFFEEGDKFKAGSKFEAQHVRDQAPASSLAGIWARAQAMATSIDLRERTPQEFTPPAADASLFNSLAAGAFQLLQRERGIPAQIPPRKLPKLPPPLDKIPDIVKPIRPGKGLAGLGTLLLVVIVALALSKGKR